MPVISADKIGAALRTRIFGRRLELFEKIESTNSYLKAKPDAEHGLVVISDGQSGGRGTRERGFISPAGQGVYMSLFFRPNGVWARPESSRYLTMLMAVAAVSAIEGLLPLRCGIKWINDIYIGGKKVAGILTEGTMRADGALAFVVSGIGINTGAVPPEVEAIAASLACELGREVERERLAAEFLNAFEEGYEAADFAEISQKYKGRLIDKERFGDE